jgi:hypothetical protein
MKVVDLKNVCNKWNIHHGKYQVNTLKHLGRNKIDYVEKILQRVETIHHKATIIGKMEKFIDNTWYDHPAPLHEDYFNYFNFIDIGDRYYYAVNECHPNYFWKSKMLQAMMRLGTINVWTYYSQEEYLIWLDFRMKLAEELVKY